MAEAKHTPIDLDALEKVARDAGKNLPGEWRINTDEDAPSTVAFLDDHAGERRWVAFAHCSGGCLEWVTASDHIATFDPPTVLRMLEAIREAQGVIDGVRDDLHQRRVGDWYPEGAHAAATQMSEDMRLIGNRLADVDLWPSVETADGEPTAAARRKLAGYETLKRILAYVADGDVDAHDSLRNDVEALYHLMVRWRIAAQRGTPGGSEYMDPEFCERFIAGRRAAAHRDKIQREQLLRALTAMLEETEGTVTVANRGLGLARYQALEAVEAATGKPFMPSRRTA